MNESTSIPNGFYSPGRVRDLLRVYPELSVSDDELHAVRYTGLGVRRVSRGSTGRHRKAVLVADIEPALTWLAGKDDRAVTCIRLCYLEGLTTDRAADRIDRSQSSVTKNITRGIDKMSEFLGYDPELDHANPVDPIVAMLERLKPR